MTTLVHKRWGKEYPIYENKHIQIKHLFINQDHCTSLHCHPKKKTGLLVLKGLIKLEFLNDHRFLEPGDKIMIRQGVFHRSNAILESELFEIENPVDQNDLVRLEDKYGRSQGYETITEEIEIESIINKKSVFGDVEVEHKFLEEILPGKYMILSGGVYNIFQGEKVYVLGPGDLVDHTTINRLDKFTRENLEVLYIRRI